MKDLTDTNIYYINLDKRVDRKKLFESQEAVATMPPMHRISAVHGLSIDVKKDPRIGIKTKVHVLTEYRRSHYEIHSRGALGASFSHLKVWTEFLKSGEKYALVLEDDVNLPATFSMMVHDTAKELPPNWDIWIVGWNFTPVFKDPKEKGHIRSVIKFLGAHCYILSRKAAKILMENATPIETHVEHYINNMAFLHKLNIVCNTRLNISQHDYEKVISDVRKVGGCVACKVDDQEDAANAIRNNS